MKNILILLAVITSLNCMAQRKPYKNITERNGKIGIGTERPDELLTVKGKIHTQEVLVDMEGAVAPDYVFEKFFTGASELKPQYRLRSLEEVEQCIAQNHRLPGVPSASELDENGLALKEMNLLLLEKIEELTLYTLQQQKEIKALQEKVSQLSN